MFAGHRLYQVFIFVSYLVLQNEMCSNSVNKNKIINHFSLKNDKNATTFVFNYTTIKYRRIIVYVFFLEINFFDKNLEVFLHFCFCVFFLVIFVRILNSKKKNNFFWCKNPHFLVSFAFVNYLIIIFFLLFFFLHIYLKKIIYKF